MLSGGVDSSSIISTINLLFARDPRVQNVIGERIGAFHASFPGCTNDEAENVNTLCKDLHLSVHRVFPLDLGAQDMNRILDRSIEHLEAPFHNAVPIVLQLLMQRARLAGTRVVLNGHGSDELFAGYRDHFLPALADMITGLRLPEALLHFEGIRRTLGVSRKQILRALKGELLHGSQSLEHGICADNFFALVRDDVLRTHAPLNSNNADLRIVGKSRLGDRLRRELFLSNLPPWLQIEDRVSMSESIESRLPFLDHRIVEFALSLDDKMKVGNGTGKLLLREAMKDRLPRSIVADPRKIGFSGPDEQWLFGPLRTRLEATFLNGTTPLLCAWLEKEKLRETIESFQNGERSSSGIWRLFNTELFLRRYFDGGQQVTGSRVH
jgi:asparagine synthase (glutamine-hydrolysing)